jgi:protoporphyrinogen oxidase
MAARVNCPGIKSKDNVPPNCSSMQFEIYHHPDEVINRDNVIENTLQALLKMKICKEEDVLFADYRLLPYGNVLFLHGMEEKGIVSRHISGSMELILSGVLVNGTTYGVIKAT